MVIICFFNFFYIDAPFLKSAQLSSAQSAMRATLTLLSPLLAMSKFFRKHFLIERIHNETECVNRDSALETYLLSKTGFDKKQRGMLCYRNYESATGRLDV